MPPAPPPSTPAGSFTSSSASPGISVALPVYQAAATLRRAIDCILKQTFRDLDVMLILNGSDADTRVVAAKAARDDKRVRVLSLPEPNLAAALNLAFEQARFDLVARMDADDLCPPERLATQARHLAKNPRLAGVGCAYHLAKPDGSIITTIHPPTDPKALRWRLLLGNMLAHGSMLLRRGAVRGVGGYDVKCHRAQDYDLWLRMTRTLDLAAVPDTLYTHFPRDAEDPFKGSPQQADIAARAMLASWRALSERLPVPTGAPDPVHDALRQVIASEAKLGSPGPRQSLEHLLEKQPARETLLAWLWANWYANTGPRRSYDASRLSRLREMGLILRGRHIPRIYLYGAGDHTRFVLEHESELGIPIAGIVDDHAAGAFRFGKEVLKPDSLLRAEVALISSDWHEETIWNNATHLRERGVHIVRLYHEPIGIDVPEAIAPPSAARSLKDLIDRA